MTFDDGLLALRDILIWEPWKKRGISRAVGAYLDGDDHALDACPTIKAKIDNALVRFRAAQEG